MTICQYCKMEIDFSKAAIVLGDRPQHEPFIEDWRDALLAAVESNDLRQRGRL